MNENIIIRKLDLSGVETWRYPGRVLSSTPDQTVVEAFFNRDDLPFHGITLKRNDRFIETYFNDGWYNIFAIYDQDDGRLKGWYCNICQPPVITPEEISYIDLALDLLVFPDGTQIVLDEDEFEVLPVSPQVKRKARRALKALQALFLAKLYKRNV